MSKPAALYARVSSDRQREQETIASQTGALQAYAAAHDYLVPREWVFEDDGYSGTTLVRPGFLEGRAGSRRVGPDRGRAGPRPGSPLSRKYAYQILLTEESRLKCGGGDRTFPPKRHRRRSPARAGAGDDRGIRAGADCGTDAARGNAMG